VGQQPRSLESISKGPSQNGAHVTSFGVSIPVDQGAAVGDAEQAYRPTHPMYHAPCAVGSSCGQPRGYSPVLAATPHPHHLGLHCPGERTVGFALHAPTFGLPATIIASGARTLSLAHVSPAELVGASITIQHEQLLRECPLDGGARGVSASSLQHHTPVAAPHDNCAPLCSTEAR